MTFPYAIKGCSHCDSNEDCPIELKRSRENLLDKPKIIKEGLFWWTSFCIDFFRVIREATR